MFQIAEVIETKKAFKPNQKDDEGNILPLGSILIRIGGDTSLLGQVRNVYARPMFFNRRIPLIGEQVIVMTAPVHDYSARPLKAHNYLYFNPYNATDDLVLHQFPKLWLRSKHVKGGKSGSNLADKEQPGYTFPKVPKKTENIQPFEGDDIYEGRFGQSIRFGTSVESGDTSIYSKKPTWKGQQNTDPITIIRVKKPTAPGNYNFNYETKNNPKSKSYEIEDIGKDESSIYITSTQKIPNFKAGFLKNRDVIQIPSFSSTSQIIVNSGRVVLNAQKDKIFIVGKSDAIITAPKIIFQTNKYKVSVDDLMDYINDHVKQLWLLVSGQRQFSTSTGPTLTATNMGEVTRLHKSTFPSKFKIP